MCDISGNESWSLHYIFAVIVYLNRILTTKLQNYTMISSVSAFFFKKCFKDIMELLSSTNYIKCVRDVTRHHLIASLLLSIYLTLYKVTVNIQT